MKTTRENSGARPHHDECIMKEFRPILDEHCDSLSPDVIERLGASRKQALAQLRKNQSDTNRVGNGRIDQLISGIRQWKGLSDFQPSRLQGMATCGIAGLAFMLFLGTSQINPLTSEPLSPNSSELVTSDPLLQTASLSTEESGTTVTESTDSVQAPISDAANPPGGSSDSLDLVGSVEFLLWLEAQQG